MIRNVIDLQSAEETAPESAAPFGCYKLTWKQREKASFSAHSDYASIRRKNQPACSSATGGATL
jgi:hypothetical protein